MASSELTPALSRSPLPPPSSALKTSLDSGYWVPRQLGLLLLLQQPLPLPAALLLSVLLLLRVVLACLLLLGLLHSGKSPVLALLPRVELMAVQALVLCGAVLVVLAVGQKLRQLGDQQRDGEG